MSSTPSRTFDVLTPDGAASPVVVSVPHAGRDYPANLTARTRLDLSQLRRSEDIDVDALFQAAPGLGATLVVARTARLYVDLNRAADEIDAAMFDGALSVPVDPHSARMASGLGVFPRIAASGAEIYAAKLSADEAEKRIADVHRPFHETLGGILAATRSRRGFALLLDGHSMPSVAGPGEPDSGRRRADFVLGDRHGESATGAVAEEAARLLRAKGYTVARNAPYAGAYIASRHGRPEAGIHALQIEINRALYIDERRLERTRGFARLAADLGDLVAGLARLDLAPAYREAAE